MNPDVRRFLLRGILFSCAGFSAGYALGRLWAGEDLLAWVWVSLAVIWGSLACLVGTVLLPKKES